MAILSSQLASAAVNVNQFSPSANPAYVYSEDALMSSMWGAKGQGRVLFGAYYQMVNDPLVELNEGRTERRYKLVDSLNSLNLSVGYGISQAIQFGASTALNMVKLPGQAAQFAMGDSKLFTKFRLNSDRAAVTLALMPELYLPSGNRSLYVSTGGFGGGIKFIAEKNFGFMQIAANVGYRYMPDAVFRDWNQKQVLPLSLGALIPVSSKWAINTEARGDIAVPFDRYHNPSSFYAGARYRLKDVVLSAGGAIGTVNSYDSTDLSIIAGITVMPSAEKEAEPVIVKAIPVVAPVVAKVEAPKPRVVFTAKELVISEEVKFEHGKAVLTASGQDLLDEVAKVLKQNKNSFTSVSIEGHTNRLGSHAYNNKLSRERAKAVREYLVARGIPNSLLGSVGFGKTKPKQLAGLSDEAQLAADRRVEFKVKLDKKQLAAAKKAWDSKQSAVTEN